MSELRDSWRVIWLMLCIIGIISRRPFLSPLGRIYWKRRGLGHWRQIREIYARHGIELRVP